MYGDRISHYTTQWLICKGSGAATKKNLYFLENDDGDSEKMPGSGVSPPNPTHPPPRISHNGTADKPRWRSGGVLGSSCWKMTGLPGLKWFSHILSPAEKQQSVRMEIRTCLERIFAWKFNIEGARLSKVGYLHYETGMYTSGCDSWENKLSFRFIWYGSFELWTSFK